MELQRSACELISLYDLHGQTEYLGEYSDQSIRWNTQGSVLRLPKIGGYSYLKRLEVLGGTPSLLREVCR
jgi:hypothetical protein